MATSAAAGRPSRPLRVRGLGSALEVDRGADAGAAAPAGASTPSSSFSESNIVPAGFEDIRFELASHELVFADADEWWAWTWAHGRRGILSRMTEDELAAYRAGAAERIAAMSPAVEVFSARFAFARKP